jgi:hypothetical protein
MVQKFEKYLHAKGLSSGIEISKNNFPDKDWLVLAVATLSKGKDEIFHPDYLPSKKLSQVVEEQLDHPMFNHIPYHLQAKGRGRSFKLNPLTKAQKIEQQLKLAEDRIDKQKAEKTRLKEALTIVNSKDQDKILKLNELEKIRAEVRAEMNDQANAFVQEQIK